MNDANSLRVAKTVGTFIAVGLSLCAIGWVLRSTVAPLTFLLWLFGVPITILSIPIGAAVWLGGRKSSSDVDE